MKKNLLIISSFLLLMFVILFYFYGRSVWVPLKIKILGQKTLEETVKKYEEKVRKQLNDDFYRAGIEFFPDKLLIIALKEEKIIEVWGKKKSDFKFIKNYQFTGFSGKTGPKLKNGDRQIPEGIYQIGYLNPNSSYHLSMQISYPNGFDREMAKNDKRTDLGGDIMIHGKNGTIGCIPIGDQAIEELFIMVYRTGINHTKVIIAPHDFRVKPAFPSLKKINWEKELYSRISQELNLYKKTNVQ